MESGLTIGEVARVSGLTRKALMVLEREGGIVPGRAGNGYRLYSEEQARQAGIARKLRDAGLPAAAIRDLVVKKRGASGRTAKLEAVEKALDGAKAALLQKRRAVDDAIGRLDALIEECRTAKRAARAAGRKR